jgi:predicted RNase H-like HicB family nuclease
MGGLLESGNSRAHECVTFPMKWRVVLEQDQESGDWAIWVPELPGCASAGQSQDEALANIREAIELYLQQDPILLPPNALVREVAA